MLQPEHRYADGPSDPLADALRTLTAADLDFYVLKKGEELTATLDAVRTLRDRLFRALGESVLTVGAETLSGERLAELEAFVRLGAA